LCRRNWSTEKGEKMVYWVTPFDFQEKRESLFPEKKGSISELGFLDQKRSRSRAKKVREKRTRNRMKNGWGTENEKTKSKIEGGLFSRFSWKREGNGISLFFSSTVSSFPVKMKFLYLFLPKNSFCMDVLPFLSVLFVSQRTSSFVFPLIVIRFSLSCSSWREDKVRKNWKLWL